jgi:hypothetical protein
MHRLYNVSTFTTVNKLHILYLINNYIWPTIVFIKQLYRKLKGLTAFGAYVQLYSSDLRNGAGTAISLAVVSHSGSDNYGFSPYDQLENIVYGSLEKQFMAKTT